MEFDNLACEKFKRVRSSIFSLSFIGLKPNTISPFLQSFIYKTYCLSNFTYALETTYLKTKTLNFLNICQNDCIRQIIGLRKYSHISNILKCLKIFNLDDLYIFSKIFFIYSIKNNQLSSEIFNYLCKAPTGNKSKSFKKDILTLEKKFNTNISTISNNAKTFKNKLKENFNLKDNGICETIMTCINKLKCKFYKFFLSNLIKCNFLK